MRTRELLVGAGLYLLSLAVGVAFGVPALVQVLSGLVGAFGLMIVADAADWLYTDSYEHLLRLIRSVVGGGKDGKR